MPGATAVIKAAVLAGLMAGAVTSAFHLALAEPLIERAIALEKQAVAEHGERAGAPVVSRALQRKGLVLGLLVYGAVWGALVGVVYVVVERWRGLWDARTSGWLLATAVGWAVAWFPFLKYPANPPGVGEGATIAYRQLLYLAFLALSAAGAALAFFVHRRASRAATSGGRRRAVVPAAYAVYAVGLYLAMPGNPDPIRMAPGLLWTFRLVSLAGLVVFWVGLATSFAWLVRARA